MLDFMSMGTIVNFKTLNDMDKHIKNKNTSLCIVNKCIYILALFLY